MNKDKGLRQGIWCRPPGKEMWRAIMDIAEKLGMHGTGHTSVNDRPYVPYSLIGYLVQGNCVAPIHRSLFDASGWIGNELPVHEFIGRMYEQAEINKMAKEDVPEQVPTPPLGIVPQYIWKEQRLRDLNAAMTRFIDARMEVPAEWSAEHSWLCHEVALRAGTTESPLSAHGDHEKRIKALEEKATTHERWIHDGCHLGIELLKKRVSQLENRPVWDQHLDEDGTKRHEFEVDAETANWLRNHAGFGKYIFEKPRT